MIKKPHAQWLRNSHVIGVSDDCAFQSCCCDQCSLLETDETSHQRKNLLHDPLPLLLFDVLCAPCVPLLGTYGENYFPSLPIVLLSVPATPFDPDRLPPSLIGYLDFNLLSTTTMYAMIHPRPPKATCQHFMCNSVDEVILNFLLADLQVKINMMFHCWVYQDMPFQGADIQKEVEMGLFASYNADPAHQDMHEQKLAGMPFEKLETRWVTVHFNCFSPCNAHVFIFHYWVA